MARQCEDGVSRLCETHWRAQDKKGSSFCCGAAVLNKPETKENKMEIMASKKSTILPSPRKCVTRDGYRDLQ